MSSRCGILYEGNRNRRRSSQGLCLTETNQATNSVRHCAENWDFKKETADTVPIVNEPIDKKKK